MAGALNFHILKFADTPQETVKNVNDLGTRSAEELVISCAQDTGVGPVSRHLFGLYLPSKDVWLNCNENLEEWTHSRSLQFRVRFKPSNIAVLRQVDQNTFDYYFHQVRYDYLHGKYPRNLVGKVLGLVVADLLRVILDKNIPLEDALERLDLADFLPHQYLVKKNSIVLFKSNAIKQELTKAWHNSQKNADYVKQEFVESLAGKKQSDLLPNYHMEQFQATYDNHSTCREVLLELQPYNGCRLTVRNLYDAKENWTPICSIRDLCFVSVQSTNRTVEISRRNGIPLYLSFATDLALKSFVSLLDGYYRLTEKWSFSICREISSPSLARLKTLKCHGPVGLDFAYRKLKEKGRNKAGTYLLRESLTQYDEYKLDVLSGNGHVKTFKIEVTPDSRYKFDTSDESFASLSDLLGHFVVDSGDDKAGGRLGSCLPPSEYDHSNLLLLCNHAEENKKESPSESPERTAFLRPEIIAVKELYFDITAVYSRNSRYRVRLAKLRSQDVIVKEAKDRDKFLETVSSWMHVKCDSIVRFLGITLHSPLSLVMEYLPFGPLDLFLSKHQSSLKIVDLIEAVTYAARALWYLEENGLIHGLIRCRNLLVYEYTECSLKVKLTDPLGNCDMIRASPWISPEQRERGREAMSSASDVWAFGTTLWEIFSYGVKPTECDVIALCQPLACPPQVWLLMKECWSEDADYRKQPQSIVRDVSQVLYEVYNSRRINCYSTPYEPKANREKQSSFIRSILSPANSTFSLVRSSVTSTTTLFTGSSGSDLISICSESNADDGNNAPFTSEAWVIEANQLHLGKVLGQGCYGEVIKAVFTQWAGLKEEVVAVKRINQNIPSEVGLQDMKREIEIMKKLSHKNIVEIKGFVEEPQIMLVMEYVELGSLVCYLKSYRGSNSTEASSLPLIKFASDIAEGMEYLESKSIVHRDLAARNILVAGSDHVKISDFGLAQTIDPKDHYYKMQTQRGLPLRWYAPESLRLGNFSHKSDVWSFGVTLWEMWTFGKDPVYPGAKDDPDLLSQLDSGLRLQCPEASSLEVYRIMTDCWKNDSHQRPSFSDLKREIEGIDK